MTSPLLEVREMTKYFGGIHALKALQFSISKGEIFSIIGPNGAGKSTVFNCINGIYKPDSGSIFYKGQDITGWPPHRVAKSGISRTFQNLELFKYMSTIDNLLLGRHLKMKSTILQVAGLNILRSKAALEEVSHRAKVEEIIDLLDLQAYRDYPVFALSYGKQKLVELGRALAMEPSLLLLDEPAAGLNNEERQDMIYWINDIRDQLEISIIIIEHNMQMVKDISDRVLALNFGKKIAEGKPEEVLQNQDVIMAYLGEEIT
ncbi:MAG TPA: ABC transporter ATP-binding protein [Saprospiraceae bacterium]|nr:ABC transporter ATP-binding protein [Saprospiraceae bacterium]